MLSPPFEGFAFLKNWCKMPFGLKTTCLAMDAFKMLNKKHMLSPPFEGFAFLTNWCKMPFGLKPHV